MAMIEEEKRDRDEWAALLAEFSARGGVVATPAPSAGFKARVLDAARAECASTLRFRRVVVAISGIAAALVAAFIVAAKPSLVDFDAHQAKAMPMPTLASEGASCDFAAAAAWLASAQNVDGSWMDSGAGREYAPAVTALATMALSRSDGHAHDAEIAKAIAALESMQRDDGSFGALGLAAIYNHAFASFALIDDAIRTGKGMTPAIGKAVAFSMRLQGNFGAWSRPGGTEGDPAVTIWEAGVLAKATRLGWRDDAGALRRAIAWLRGASADGLLDYRMALGHSAKPSSGNAVLLCTSTEALESYLASFDGQSAFAGALAASLDASLLRRIESQSAAILRSERRELLSTAAALCSSR